MTSFVDNAYTLVHLATFIGYPAVSAIALAAFDCRSVYGARYLHADYAVRCGVGGDGRSGEPLPLLGGRSARLCLKCIALRAVSASPDARKLSLGGAQRGNHLGLIALAAPFDAIGDAKCGGLRLDLGIVDH